MSQTNPIIDKEENSQSIEDALFSKVLHNDIMWDDEEGKKHFSLLSTDEKILLGNKITTTHDSIISSWIENRDMQKIYQKFDISEDEIQENISYFG
jgi:hypothetical protein